MRIFLNQDVLGDIDKFKIQHNYKNVINIDEISNQTNDQHYSNEFDQVQNEIYQINNHTKQKSSLNDKDPQMLTSEIQDLSSLGIKN